MSPYRTNAAPPRDRMLRRLGRFEQCVAAVGVWSVLVLSLGYAADHYNVGPYMLASGIAVGIVTFFGALVTVCAVLFRERD